MWMYRMDGEPAAASLVGYRVMLMEFIMRAQSSTSVASWATREHSYQSYGIIKRWKLNMQIYLNPHIRVSSIQ